MDPSNSPSEGATQTDQKPPRHGGLLGSQEELLLMQRRLTVSLLVLLTVYFIFQISAYFADILRILGISVLLSYLFINVVDFLERFLRNRAASILVVYALLTVVTVIAMVLVVPAMVYQVSQLINSAVDSLPDVLNALTRALEPLEARLQAMHVQMRAVDILSNIVANVPKPEPSVVINKISEMAMSTMAWVIYAISIAVTSFYFLLEGHRMKDWAIGLFPAKYQQSLQRLASEIDDSLQAFLRGQVALALVAGFVMLGVYYALGVSYALFLSVFLAIWEIVPVIGPPIGFAPAILAVAIHGMNFPGNRLIQIVALTIIFNVLQQVKDSVIAPRYIGNVIGLHPVVIFIAIMIGARLDGMLGIIFALPAACVITVLLRHLPLRADLPEPVSASETDPSAPAGAANATDSSAMEKNVIEVP